MKLHTVYKVTLSGVLFALIVKKIPLSNFFTLAPLLMLATNIRYGGDIYIKREKITQQNLRSKDHRESFSTVLGHLTLDAQNQLEKQNPTSPFLRFSWFQNLKLWLYNVYWSRGNCLNNGFWLLRQYLLVQCARTNVYFLYVGRRRQTHTFQKQKN